jgi:electron transport complex protein RnfA
VYLSLITTNCSILGVTKINIDPALGYNLGLALFNSLCTGIGFLAVMLIFSTIRERIAQSDVPDSLKGAPITLIAAAIMSLSLVGFSGIGT